MNQQLKTSKLKWAGLLFAVSFSLSAELPRGPLESINTPPPLLSMEAAEKVRSYFNDNADRVCRFPGSVLYFENDSTCHNPTLKYIDTYSNYLTTEEDSGTAGIDTGLSAVENFRIATSTYRRLGLPRNQNRKSYQFVHATYLKYLEEENKTREMPFLLRIIKRILDFINEHILQPLIRIIRMVVTPFKQLSTLWKAIVFIIGISVFILIVVILGKFTANIYPAIDRRDGAGHSRKAGETEEGAWLRKSRHAFETSHFTEALEFLYRYLMSWFLDRNKIQRYEWWTNRQFLSILRKRFSGDLPIAKSIISTYEEVIYGHFPIEPERLRVLIDQAEQLRGRSSPQ